MDQNTKYKDIPEHPSLYAQNILISKLIMCLVKDVIQDLKCGRSRALFRLSYTLM